MPHSYESWSNDTFVTEVSLTEDGIDLERDAYPVEFEEYIPDITSGGDQFLIASYPGKTSEFDDSLKLFVNNTWHPQLKRSLEKMDFQGDENTISAGPYLESPVAGWDLVDATIEKDQTTGRREAGLQFSQGARVVVARWSWEQD